MQKTESAGGIVLNTRGEIALVRHGATNFWGFPKGHVDGGETTLQAATREIAEETGIDDLEYMQDLGSYERFKSTPEGGDDTTELKKIHMFLFKTVQDRLAPRDLDNPEARWVSPTGVEKVLTNPKDKEFWRNTAQELGLLKSAKDNLRYREKNK